MIYQESIEKIKEVISQHSREQVEFDTQVQALSEKIKELEEKLKIKEEEKEEFTRRVEERVRSAVMPMVRDYANNFEMSASLNDADSSIYLLVKQAFNSGKTKENIVLDLIRKGYSKEEILNAIRLMK